MCRYGTLNLRMVVKKFCELQPRSLQMLVGRLLPHNAFTNLFTNFRLFVMFLKFTVRAFNNNFAGRSALSRELSRLLGLHCVGMVPLI